MLRFSEVNRVFATLIVLALLMDYSLGISGWVYPILIGFWATLTVIGSFHIRWNYHLEALHNNKNTRNDWVAITFDDGPHPDFTPQVLKLLSRYNAKATFFCIGKQVAQHPDIVKEIIAEGHTLGNHTYSHSKTFGFLSTEKVVEELQRTRETIQQLTGLDSILYRPAFGVTNPSIGSAVDQLGLQTIGWSIRSLDTTNRSKMTILHRITHRLKRGDIILLHDTSAKTVEVLEQLLLFLQNNNMRSITVDQLLEIEAYA
ncbi:MAG TPA: polysaccharide deacetylase family protein [Arenibacter sp.]|nr:polysaccharide deacetylase family protein [Arenibacter sp.]